MAGSMGFFDWMLVVGVSIQVAVLAYLSNPRWKAVIFTLPVPFTCAVLALGQPIDATNVLGSLLVLGFLHGVRALHERLGVLIVPSIAMAAVGYALVAGVMAGFIPRTDTAFWVAWVGVFAISLLVNRARHTGVEKEHRTSLPVWIKLPIVVALVFFLVLTKQQLLGFMTMFPMVSIFTAYETRHSLWTLCRQAPIMILAMLAMMLTCRLTQEALGLGGALGLGWVVFLAITIPFTRRMWLAAGQARSAAVAG